MEYCVFCFFKQKTAYEMRISDWSSDVCSSDLFSRHRTTRNADGREAFAMAHAILALDQQALGGADKACKPAVEPGSRCGAEASEIGRASCRARVCQYV